MSVHAFPPTVSVPLHDMRFGCLGLDTGFRRSNMKPEVASHTLGLARPSRDYRQLEQNKSSWKVLRRDPAIFGPQGLVPFGRRTAACLPEHGHALAD